MEWAYLLALHLELDAIRHGRHSHLASALVWVAKRLA
jgi:hypothetical protein